MRKVTAIVLNWNGLQDTLQCLRSLKRSDYPNLEIVIVDNGSEDQSCVEIKRQFPDAFLIENGRNLGFARGNNIGFAAGLDHGAEFLFILNNDTIVAPDCIAELVEAIQSSESLGIVGPLMRRSLRPELVDMGGDFDFWTGTVMLRRFAPGMEEQRVQIMDYVWGCGLMVRADVLRAIGFFDERYEAYYEDADFCVRARARGYQTAVATRAWMLHKVGRSGEKRFLWQTCMRLRNHVLFFLMHARPYHLVTLIPALILYQVPVMLLRTGRLYLARKLMPRYSDRPISLWYRPRR
jgi:GT2 family glycosyltransferase